MPITVSINPYHTVKWCFLTGLTCTAWDRWFTLLLAVVYLHFENALCFKHIELCGVRVHCSVLTLYIDDYFSLETRSHCLAFHVFSLSHQRVPTGDPDQRVPEDNLTPLTFSVL